VSLQVIDTSEGAVADFAFGIWRLSSVLLRSGFGFAPVASLCSCWVQGSRVLLILRWALNLWGLDDRALLDY
jgi:hypothetical protein